VKIDNGPARGTRDLLPASVAARDAYGMIWRWPAREPSAQHRLAVESDARRSRWDGALADCA
jgi:hypothetical protein